MAILIPSAPTFFVHPLPRRHLPGALAAAALIAPLLPLPDLRWPAACEAVHSPSRTALVGRSAACRQGDPPHIRVVGTAVPGGKIQVEVAAGTTCVATSLGGEFDELRYLVPKSGKVTIPVHPEARGGMVMSVAVGEGLDRKILLIDVVSP